MTALAGTTLNEGRAEAAVLVLSEPLSFWGGLDPASGRIIDRRHPQDGTAVSGRILVMEAGRGSSSGSSVLAEAIRAGTAPAGIILLRRDAIVITGALVASALYAIACPVVLARPEDWAAIAAAARLRLDAGPEEARIELGPDDLRGVAAAGGARARVNNA